ncbi:hypothetical protein CYQ88_11140 [Hydrogenovibrio sp. SC-1]|uniref:GGDEF domain-containing protein n=1 Tax=Hydrogenovibrio sp. SC-1 TaxID=2065820 RepID=UPI000C79C321|nr:GGDEF domain-containing protein [Hydrogenovibrio sp. SC-1]PLA73439.1 hypothetical protein CYQ88_11140 [Hydrogenovibrio sp. SC-1]
MEDQYIYRNELLKKYIFLALITSIFLSPIYYYIGETIVGITLNIFSLAVLYLRYSSKNNASVELNSRLFMLAVFILFFVFFINGSQEFNSTVFLLLYPIASFSIRGPKEGTIWAFVMAIVFAITYSNYPHLYNVYSFVFFIVAYFMVSYLLYYYRFYEFLNFKQINKQLEQEVEERTQELHKLSITDTLTGLYNRLKLDEVLEKEVNRSDRYDLTFGVIILDIDDFKSVNDIYGHQTGDYVLKTIADIIKENVRNTDVVGRWGGEEFMIICPESNKNETLTVAEKIREKIANYHYEVIGEKTASFGSCIYYAKMGLDKAISKADEALYLSKNNGKNTVSFSD